MQDRDSAETTPPCFMLRKLRRATRRSPSGPAAASATLIDQAAEALGTSRSEFMLETACHEAERVLLGQRLFRLDEDVFGRVRAMLDNPPPPSDAMSGLLRRKAPWD